MKKTFYTLFILLTFLLSLPASAQQEKVNTKFGNPTKEELEMTEYAYDKEASAVILYSDVDTRYEMYDEDFWVVTEVKTRIKILKEDGKDHANVQLVYYRPEEGQYKEDINSVKATAFNMVDGKVEKTKMESNLIFRERIDDKQMVLKFSVPKVQVGTVVEYQYEKRSNMSYEIDTWYAQHSIPTAYCHYHLQIPEFFQFSVEMRGHELDKMDQERKAAGFNFQTTSGSLQCSGSDYSYTGHNLSALKAENFIWSLSDVCNKVTADFHTFAVRGSVHKEYTTTWEKIDEMLMKDESFGGRMRRADPLKKEMTEAGIFDIEDQTQRIEACYDMLMKKFNWNGKYRLFGRSVRDIEKDGGGSNADLNFILINMLRDARIDAFPVVMSSRDNGTIPMTHPSINALNTFVVGIADTDSTLLFLDSSAEYGAINVIPSNLLSSHGRVVGEKVKLAGKWFNLQAASQGKQTTLVKAVLQQDGILKGTISSRYNGNSAAYKRRKFREAKDSLAYISEMAKDLNAEIKAYNIKNAYEHTEAVNDETGFEMNCNAADGMIYLQIGNLLPFSEAPFTKEKRTLPVDMPYRDYFNITFSITLPDGYAVEEIPKPSLVSLEGNDIVFTKKLSATGNTLNILVRMAINKTYYLANEYQNLKKTFEVIAEQCNDIIVIKKTS
ncbi:MAG: DUF3857 domain-containing protein [Prevotella sp.]|nr:DUF3857 domain-containing protein [Prevotella sp.]